MAEQQMDEYDVAVVVYCRSQGVDESDAQSRAERAVMDDLLEQRGGGFPLVLDSTVKVAGLSGLSHAHVVLRPDATMFKRVGMGPPKLAASKVGPWPCTVQPELEHQETRCNGYHAPVQLGASITRHGMTWKAGT